MSPIVRIATPYAASANNGNWRTAARWATLLRARFQVIVQAPGNAEHPNARPGCLIALHARRSHSVIRSWREAHPAEPLIVVLTGTDLYRDLSESIEVRDSLALADRLVVLQEDAIQYLPAEHRSKARVIYQSCTALRPMAKADGRLNCILVAHIRPEKDPLTVLAAWHRLPQHAAVFLNIIGEALDPGLARSVREAVSRDQRIRWVGAQPHAATRQLMKRAHLLLLASLMEGGANVIAEAVTAGTPVLASRISGNIGMLGAAYPGYFAVGDAQALAALLMRCFEDSDFIGALRQHCRGRRSLFSPQRERTALLALLSELL